MNELGEFLRSRRARLTPPEVGLPWRSGSRSVSGLRREEIALVAGVSADYYTRLEQGRARNVSAQVLTAVADALRLDQLERQHLTDLVKPTGRPDQPRPPKARPAIRMMLDALDPVPAVVHGPRLEVLAINRMGKVLIDDFDAMPAAERNMARWMFLNPKAREVYPDWPEIAAQMVAILRAAARPDASDPLLAALVGDLTTRSDEFARFWADYKVFKHTHGTKTFHHEAVGDLRINYESLVPAADPDLSLIIYSAATGSPSEEKLKLLSSWVTSRPLSVPGESAAASRE
ncbi:helix-turn-helix protein [Kribbella orskensis]|uniref:Helix-turn-helix protein n=1 Tax=Kribbella orskensis TaxID=2512216 RepID=A0ABY2BPF9_9ACTN|nr:MULTISPECIES: helix-turn-helix transcriptional regulator [Kribbella]TCN39715.1 helix-turn-helix protein [Kribbella sp. VKM Ac-2500]TCO27502.1 helix-turn-helix protein [Kribbella orskensis]